MIQVYLGKRFRKKRKRNGQREWVYALRWHDGSRWKCETTSTADRAQAETIRVAKRDELNAPLGSEPTREAEPVKASWQECREALERAMKADNLRPGYVSDSLRMFDVFRRTLPGITTPADVTAEDANEFKRRRAEGGLSPWSLKGDLATLKAAFGKWLMGECNLLSSNPFAKVKAPKCDSPDVRIVSAAESEALFAWFTERWNGWRLPLVYLQVAALVGWRATEIASIREEDLLADGFIRVLAESCKTRKHKYGWLPAALYAELRECAANGWAFGRFSDELRRRLILWMRRPNHAARMKDFTPKRLVGWIQDELRRFHEERAAKAEEERLPAPASFTLHDFRRTAITGLQMAGVSEKDCSLMVGCTPEVIRKHYDRFDGMVIAKRSVEKRLATASTDAEANPDAQFLRAFLRAGQKPSLDGTSDSSQTASA